MSVLPNFINGSFKPCNAKTCLVTNPATSEIVCEVPFSGRAEVDEAVVHAKAAFPAWSALTIKQRAAIMFKYHHLVEAHAQELAALVVKENGKNITEAIADIAKGNETVEWSCSLPQLACGRILEVSGGIT